MLSLWDVSHYIRNHGCISASYVILHKHVHGARTASHTAAHASRYILYIPFRACMYILHTGALHITNYCRVHRTPVCYSGSHHPSNHDRHSMTDHLVFAFQRFNTNAAGVHGIASAPRAHHGPGSAPWGPLESRLPDRHQEDLCCVDLL